MKLTNEAIRKQSESAYNQWKDQWREHAKIHSKFEMKSWEKFQNTGIGKAVVSVANGWSLELEIETLKNNRSNVDVLACDKTLGTLLKNGITPDFVMVCDANVDYERYLKPYETQLQDTTLFINVCGNPKWTANGNWKEIIFFVNKDILNSEKEFMELSGCFNVMPAGTNVSNAMVIMLTQSDNDVGKRNFFGYDKILLIGYDYSWNPKGNYYAFNKDGDGKAHYMRHIYTKNLKGEDVYTSNNLAFSSVWLTQYIQTFKLPVVQCTKETVFMTPLKGSLKDQMKYSYKKEDSTIVRDAVEKIKKLRAELKQTDLMLKDIANDHFNAMIQSI